MALFVDRYLVEFSVWFLESIFCGGLGRIRVSFGVSVMNFLTAFLNGDLSMA